MQRSASWTKKSTPERSKPSLNQTIGGEIGVDATKLGCVLYMVIQKFRQIRTKSQGAYITLGGVSYMENYGNYQVINIVVVSLEAEYTDQQ